MRSLEKSQRAFVIASAGSSLLRITHNELAGGIHEIKAKSACKDFEFSPELMKRLSEFFEKLMVPQVSFPAELGDAIGKVNLTPTPMKQTKAAAR